MKLNKDKNLNDVTEIAMEIDEISKNEEQLKEDPLAEKEKLDNSKESLMKDEDSTATESYFGKNDKLETESLKNCDEGLPEVPLPTIREPASSLEENFLEPIQTNDDIMMEVLSPKSPSVSESIASSSGCSSAKKSSIVDSLLDKMRRKNSDSSGSEISKFQQTLSGSEDDLLVEVEVPIRYNKPSNPNQMATPIVRNQRLTSVFVNNEEEYQRMVAKHKFRKQVVEDRSKMNARLEPPRMKAPEMPTNMQRPRTLADKRILVNKNDVNFLMVEQESKIFRQVQRHEQKLEINYSHLDSMMLQDIPISHGPWKVLTWLRTREGKYIQQYLNINGLKFKLSGSRGNHLAKILPKQSSDPLPKFQMTQLRSTRCCAAGRVSKRVLTNLLNSESIRKFFLEESNDLHKRLETKRLDNQLTSIKPRPLSKKIEQINRNRLANNASDDDGAFLGDYSKFEMPSILLEVEVKPKMSLNPLVKKYLKEILPHRDMDDNWCEFALSAMKMKSKEETESSKTYFDFPIPFQEGKRNILVREIVRAKEDNERLRILMDTDEDADDSMEWTFAKNVDKKDKVECEVVDIIKDLTNSVFINLNDDLFTKDDSFKRSTPSISSPIKTEEVIEELSSIVKPDKSKKVLTELKRLNANFFKSETQCVDNENDMRRHATAHLGKVERELRPTVILTDCDTVVLGTHEKESRRIKRVPKKFDDYENTVSKSLAMSDSERDEPMAKKPKTDDFKARLKQTELHSSEDLASVKREIRKMLHVSVDVLRLEHLDDIEPWCMVHKLYKCRCRGLITRDLSEVPEMTVVKPKPDPPCNVMPRKFEPPEPVTPKEPVDDGFSRRVLPVAIDTAKIKKPSQAVAVIGSIDDNLPKMEIVNLCELINGGIGPIFINVYDDKIVRLNQILRSVLNNNSAIIYFEGFAYFVDKKRVNIDKLDFSRMEPELDHPIFILQAKDSSPSPISITKPDDFVNFMINKNSNGFIQISDKSALKDISEIIESILRNVRRKIELQVGNDANDLVKEQLSMLTHDRSRSASFSSTNSSPLSFNGRRLTEAPPPGIKTPMMQEFNKIFSVRMQRLVALIGSNSLGLKPSNEMLNKFYIYQWHFLLQSFEEDLVQIWQVRLEGESGANYQNLVLTDTRDVPDVEHAKKENIVNIRKLKLSDSITELTRMILLRVENATMKNMTILFYGCKGYMRICGILNSKENYLSGFVAKPSRSTHPRIAAKIQKVYHIWYGSKSGQNKRRFEMEKENRLEVLKDAHEAAAAKQVEEGKKVTAHPNGTVKKPGQSDFKWFLFNITNDFSDIYIKSWSRYLSYKIIMEAIERAKLKKRAVALESTSKFLRKWPRIFALPSAPLKFKEHDSMTENFLIFGPYMRQSNSNLLLMQNVDGELILRDEYEKRNLIQRETRTRCLWIYANTLKCIHDADPEPFKLWWRREVPATSKPGEPAKAKVYKVEDEDG